MDPMPKVEQNRIITLVKNNNVEEFKLLTTDLLTSGSIRNQWGHNLLQIAIRYKSREVFEYLLSIDFPLNLTDPLGRTALSTSLRSATDNNLHYTNRLIEKGADVSVLHWRDLHNAVKKDQVSVAKCLIENGIDVNARNGRGGTAFHLAFDLELTDAKPREMLAMLLFYGADPLIRDSKGYTPFDITVIKGCYPEQTRELLFLYMFDQYTEYELKASVLLQLAGYYASFFLQMYRNVVAVDWDDGLEYCSCYVFMMDVECLVALVENFPELVLPTLLRKLEYDTCGGHMKSAAKNLYYLSTSNLQEELICFISNTESDFLVDYIILNEASTMDLSEITELYCFMLSYGLRITEYDVQSVYQRFGYCELFKILLHMDIEDYFDLEKYPPGDAFPTLCYKFGDVDFETISFFCENVAHLIHYYNDRVVKEDYFYLRFEDESVVAKLKSMSKVPLLVELARNAFRKYFVDKFQITKSRQFYTLLNELPISIVYKKIITLETKLY